MARVVAAIANGGIVYKPYLVEKVESPAGEILYQAKPEVQSRLGASPANLEAVRQALVGVVNDRHGQGRPPAQHPGGRQNRHRPGGGPGSG